MVCDYGGNAMKIELKNEKNRICKMWKSLTSIRETTVIMIIVMMVLVLSILSPHFLTRENIVSTAIGLSADGIITVGMTIVLISGGFDFSVGSVMSLSGIVAGFLYLSGANIWVACLIAILIGLACGLVNGAFIGYIGLNPFITTLAVMGIARGLSFVLTHGSPISLLGVSNSFTFMGQGEILGIPVIVAIFILIAIVGDFMIRRSELIRKVFYTGSNEKAAKFSGINTSKVKMQVYLLVAAFSSIAGILTLARFTVAAPTAGLGADASIRCISAAVIGGTSLSGGEGTILGSVLGIILLNIISNGLILLNVPVYWQDLINGVILITAVTIDYLSHKNKTKNLKLNNNI
jgi:ribose transport system permease protein